MLFEPRNLTPYKPETLVVIESLSNKERVVNQRLLDVQFIGTVDWQFPGLAFVVILLLLIVIILLLRAKPRQEVDIVISDPPPRNPKDPAFIRRRARAAAVAMVHHRKRHASGELDENR